MGKWKWKWNILIVLGYVRIQTIKVHIIDKKALGWNSTHLILAIYRMVGKPTIWVEIQHAPMTMWLWGWGFKPVLAQCVPHSCHEGTTHRRLNWRGFKKKSCIQRLSQCSFCHKLVGFPTSKKGQKLKNVSRHLNFFVGSRLKPSNIQDNMDRKHHAKNWVPNNKNKWNPCQKLKYALWCSGVAFLWWVLNRIYFRVATILLSNLSKVPWLEMAALLNLRYFRYFLHSNR